VAFVAKVVTSEKVTPSEAYLRTKELKPTPTSDADKVTLRVSPPRYDPEGEVRLATGTVESIVKGEVATV
jgi:hypothetical protein